MIRWGMVIDLDKCMACQACVIACQIENNVPPPSPGEAAIFRSIGWIRMVEHIEGEYPNIKANIMPVPCMQCENPPCVKVCPVRTTYREADGPVVIDYNWCIGCRMCMSACPYWARRINLTKPVLPKEAMNPVTHYLGNRPRMRGVVEKCHWCLQRTRRGRYPACVEVCPVGARKFGNLLDPESEVSLVLARKNVFRLKAELNTFPKFFYFYD